MARTADPVGLRGRAVERLTPANRSSRVGRVKEARNPRSLAGRIQVREILDQAARAHGRSISKQRARALEDHPDFPEPEDVLEDGQGRPMPIWQRSEIEEYAASRSMAAGRPPAPAVKG